MGLGTDMSVTVADAMMASKVTALMEAARSLAARSVAAADVQLLLQQQQRHAPAGRRV